MLCNALFKIFDSFFGTLRSLVKRFDKTIALGNTARELITK